MHILEKVEATKRVPATHPARAIRSGALRLGVLSAKWAMTGAKIRDTKPCTVRTAVVIRWVLDGSMLRRDSSIKLKIGTTKPYRNVSGEELLGYLPPLELQRQWKNTSKQGDDNRRDDEGSG